MRSEPVRGKVPCPACQGTGVIDARICRDTRANGKPCRTLARMITDPGYEERFSWDPQRFPPHFMDYCSRHGNQRKRQFNRKQERAMANAGAKRSE